MSEFPLVYFSLLLAMNPLLIASAMSWRPAPVVAGQAAVAGGVILAVLAAISEPLLDLLSIEPETFRIGAGAIMGVAGAAAFFPFHFPRAIPAPGESPGPATLVPVVFPIAWPGIASAGAVVVAMNYGANGELPATLVAVVLAAAVCGAVLVMLAGRYPFLSLAFGRLCGAALVVLAADMIVSGVKVV